MLERTKTLLEVFTGVCDNYEKYYMPIRADVYEQLPEIQWFIEQLLTMITDMTMQQEVMGILKDMLEALKEEDEVLLYDALRYGLMEYMKAVIDILEE